LAALMVVGVAIATPACAAQTYGYRGDPYRGAQRQASAAGYQDGLQAGRDDARRRRPYEPARSIRYRSADRDYRGRDRDRSLDDYKREYRSAFMRGYADGYRGGRRRY
jgi:hypothetical protein